MKAELGPAFEQSFQQGQGGDQGESLGARPAVWRGRTVCSGGTCLEYKPGRMHVWTGGVGWSIQVTDCGLCPRLVWVCVNMSRRHTDTLRLCDPVQKSACHSV